MKVMILPNRTENDKGEVEARSGLRVRLENGDIVEQRADSLTAMALRLTEMLDPPLDMPLTFHRDENLDEPVIHIRKGGRNMDTFRGWLEMATSKRGTQFATDPKMLQRARERLAADQRKEAA